jgi:putative phosphonate metabolism protein
MAARYAIYFAPEPDSALWAFGCRAVGRDADGGGDVAPFVPEGFSADEWRELTASANRYGFHATLKAPFALAEGRGEDDLLRAFTRFAAEQAPVRGPALQVALHDCHVALMLPEAVPGVQALAASCVSTFDDFRAPMSQADRQKRLAGGMSGALRQNLERWGYPYVFGAFTFHMTLAGPVPEERAEAARAALAAEYKQAVGDEAFRLGEIAVFREPEAGAPFEAIARARLSAR